MDQYNCKLQDKNEITKGEEINILVLKEKTLLKNNPKTLDYVSVAKIISSYGVIALHLNKFWKYDQSKKKIWVIYNFYETFFYYSVPLFTLCIGATLLNFNERYGLLEYNKKRLIKVFIPLMGWTLILYLYKVYILKNISKIPFNFIEIWNYFFLSKINKIFNSLHIFLLTYMLIPLLAYIDKENKIKIYIYYFFLLLITQSFFPYLYILSKYKLVWIYKLDIGYLIYIFAGYIIQNLTFSSLTKFLIYILGIFGFFIHLIGTRNLAFKYNKILLTHKGYLNIPCICYSCSLFLFIKEYCFIITKLINRKYLNRLGSLTLGPFFLHFTVKETLYLFPKFRKLIDFNVLFYSFVVFLICIAISSILRNIHLLKFLIP